MKRKDAKGRRYRERMGRKQVKEGDIEKERMKREEVKRRRYRERKNERLKEENEREKTFKRKRNVGEEQRILDNDLERQRE